MRNQYSLVIVQIISFSQKLFHRIVVCSPQQVFEEFYAHNESLEVAQETEGGTQYRALIVL